MSELAAYGLGTWARRDPRRPALLLGDGAVVDYGTLHARAAAIALALVRAGAGPEAPVALRLPNGAAFVEVTSACNLLGIVHVPLGAHTSAEETAWIVRDAGARVLVAERDWLAAAGSALPDVTTLAAEELGAAPPAPPDALARLDGPPRAVDGYRMTYTSGTTGRPKAILRDTEGGVEWMCRLWRALGLRADERHCSPGPYYHAGPNTFVMGQLLFGGAIAVQERFDAAAMLAAVERERLTSLQLVPTMLQRIRALPAAQREAHDLVSLRVVFHAAAPCPPDLKRWALDFFGPERVREYYASSEVGATLISGAEWLARPGSVGRPLPGCQACVVDAEGRVLPRTVTGRVCLRAEGRSTFHYRGGDGADAAAALGDGWVATDDVGYLDADGYLFLVDRDADVVISGGVNVYTRKVEHVLLEHPAIADAAVLGIPDPDFGERVVAAVQLRAGADAAALDELDQLARERLAPAERPRLVHVVPELPRSPAGKVLKTDLRRTLAGTDAAWHDPDRTPRPTRSA